jgi:hypothetical protein
LNWINLTPRTAGARRNNLIVPEQNVQSVAHCKRGGLGLRDIISSIAALSQGQLGASRHGRNGAAGVARYSGKTWVMLIDNGRPVDQNRDAPGVVWSLVGTAVETTPGGVSLHIG